MNRFELVHQIAAKMYERNRAARLSFEAQQAYEAEAYRACEGAEQEEMFPESATA